MKYVNGKEYICQNHCWNSCSTMCREKLLYIPRQGNTRAGWGSVNGTRMMLRNRNTEICMKYQEGATVQELMDAYHLWRIVYVRY